MSICAASNCDQGSPWPTAPKPRPRLASHARRSLAAALATLVMTCAAVLHAEEQNLAAAGQGAQVIKYTSEQGGPWRAENIIADQATPPGWASADGSLPQELIVRLPVSSRFNTLIVSLSGGSPQAEWARAVSVYAADPFPTMGGWRLVGSVELAPTPGDQVFAVAPSEGRFIRVLITSAQSPGAARVSLGRFKLFWR